MLLEIYKYSTLSSPSYLWGIFECKAMNDNLRKKGFLSTNKCKKTAMQKQFPEISRKHALAHTPNMKKPAKRSKQFRNRIKKIG